MTNSRNGTPDFAVTAEREPIRTREVGWGLLASFVGMTAALLLLVPLARTTAPGELLSGPIWWENLSLFAILIAVTIGGIAVGLGRLRLSDLGLRRDKLIEALVVVVAVWAAMQLWPWLAMGSAEIANHWADPGVYAMLRWAGIMFLATALWEEVAFRGLLLPQLYLKLPGGHKARLATALLGSQLLFAAAHIPAHVMVRELWGFELVQMLLLQGFAGLLLGLLYLRTRNLWIVIGFHGLANAPTALFGGALGWEIPLIMLLVAWPFVTRRPSQRGLASVSDRAGPPEPRRTQR